jgi:hypothetical protein
MMIPLQSLTISYNLLHVKAFRKKKKYAIERTYNLFIDLWYVFFIG